MNSGKNIRPFVKDLLSLTDLNLKNIESIEVIETSKEKYPRQTIFIPHVCEDLKTKAANIRIMGLDEVSCVTKPVELEGKRTSFCGENRRIDIQIWNCERCGHTYINWSKKII